MKRAKLQWKLTCWFSAALLLMALLTFVIVFFVSHSVLQKNLKDELIHTVEDNLDEVEFYRSVSQMHIDGDTDQYIHYGVGYLEIDDDFLDQVNGICTGLYRENGELLYGENPITEVEIPAFADGVCHRAARCIISSTGNWSNPPFGNSGCGAWWRNLRETHPCGGLCAFACGVWGRWCFSPLAAGWPLPGGPCGPFATCLRRRHRSAAGTI